MTRVCVVTTVLLAPPSRGTRTMAQSQAGLQALLLTVLTQ